jgi:hypothetical protein
MALAGCGPTAPEDSGIDAGTEAVAIVAPSDADLDARRDAYASDADLPRAFSFWRNPTPPDCSRFSANPPRWAPSSPVGDVGVTRWTVSSSQPALGIVATWDHPPPTRASAIEPVLTGAGAVIWNWSDWLETGLDYTAGNARHFGSSAPGRMVDPVEFNYTRFPRMWLPPHDGVYFANGWAGWPLRVPTYDIADTPSPERSGALVGISRGDVSPYFARGGSRDSWMPRWSPQTGDIIGLGESIGASPDRAGIVSGCESGVRWATEVPTDGGGSIFVRENGEVIVVTTYELLVLDGLTGEPRRSALIRIPGLGLSGRSCRPFRSSTARRR